MKRAHPGALAALALALGTASCGHSSSRSTSLVIAGSTDFTGATGQDLAIDPGLGVVYVAGGFGQIGLVRVDVSGFPAMTATTFTASYGGGVAIDVSTHRVASTGGYGQVLGVLEPGGATYDAQPIIGCGGSVAAGDGTFLASTQCTDTFSVYDEAARAVVFDVPAAGTGGHAIFNGASGAWYVNRTPKANNGGIDDAMVIAPVTGGGYSAADFPMNGTVAAADPILDRIWIYEAVSGGAPWPLVALDGTSLSPVFAAPLTTTGGAIAIVGGALYQNGADGHVRLFDARSGELLDDLDFPTASGGYDASSSRIVADSARAFVVGTKSGEPLRLFAIDRVTR